MCIRDRAQLCRGRRAYPDLVLLHQSLCVSGCFCTFSDGLTFEYIRTSLEKTLLSNLEAEDRLPFQGLPLVIVFAADVSLTEKELENLKEEGQALADRYYFMTIEAFK